MGDIGWRDDSGAMDVDDERMAKFLETDDLKTKFSVQDMLNGRLSVEKNPLEDPLEDLV